MTMRLNPIPPIPSVKGWEGVSISAVSETLVPIRNVSERIVTSPYYHQSGIPGSLPEIYLRERVAELLAQASNHLPQGYRFIVWDGYRPVQVQQNLYDAYLREIKSRAPQGSEEEWTSLASQFVSIPSTNPTRPSPHLTGGSVDLTIMDHQGNMLNMGTEFDDFSEKAHTRYFENLLEGRTLTDAEEECLHNRRLLFHALASAGFTNYHMEWWHFDYGNQFWAKVKGAPKAFYSAAAL